MITLPCDLLISDLPHILSFPFRGAPAGSARAVKGEVYVLQGQTTSALVRIVLPSLGPEDVAQSRRRAVGAGPLSLWAAVLRWSGSASAPGLMAETPWAFGGGAPLTSGGGGISADV